MTAKTSLFTMEGLMTIAIGVQGLVNPRASKFGLLELILKALGKGTS